MTCLSHYTTVDKVSESNSPEISQCSTTWKMQSTCMDQGTFQAQDHNPQLESEWVPGTQVLNRPDCLKQKWTEQWPSSSGPMAATHFTHVCIFIYGMCVNINVWCQSTNTFLHTHTHTHKKKKKNCSSWRKLLPHMFEKGKSLTL